MIEIARPNGAHTLSILQQPGAFCWWYADLTDDQGSGCVVVWSFALPFLPGSREHRQALLRPAVHFAVYEKGQAVIYLLQEYSSEDTNIDPHSGCGHMGDSHFSITHSAGEMCLQITLKQPVPHSKNALLAKLEIRGPSVPLKTSPQNVLHAWMPQSTHASGILSWTWNGISGAVNGRAYVDANLSRHALHTQGIESWRWGRLSFRDRCITYYDILGADGTQTQLLAEQTNNKFALMHAQLIFSKLQKGRYGVRSPRKVSIITEQERIDAELMQLVDDGPFYQRFVLTGMSSQMGDLAHGIAEVVLPNKVDVPWQRPFVRMRTHRINGPNSAWLPLFSGHRQARLSRLLRSLSRAGLHA